MKNLNSKKLYNPTNLSYDELVKLKDAVKNVEWYFTDTRDGTQNAFISSSLDSTYKIIQLISNYIKAINGILEGGYAGATCMEHEKYDFIKKCNIRLSAFGSSKVNSRDIESHFKPIIDTNTEIATIFVKCNPSQIAALNITKEENILLIKSSIIYLIENKKEVIVDMEHFFDGYNEDQEYTKECIKIILDSGAEKVVLCDTLGKTSPDNIKIIIDELCDEMISPTIAKQIKGKIGLHLHEDTYNTTESVIKALSTGNISHVQGNFGYSGERVGNTPLALLFTKLYENYDIDLFENLDNRDLLWKNLLSTYSQISYLLNGKFPGKIDRILNPENYYHGAGLHVLALKRDIKTYSTVSEKLLNNLDISNYPGLTKQSGKYNISYYLNKAFYLDNISLDRIGNTIDNLLNLLKQKDSLDYTDSLASFILQGYKVLNYKNDESIQKIINEEFGISKITTSMETNNDGEHLNTIVSIKTEEKTFVTPINEDITDIEKENGVFNGVFTILKDKLREKNEFIDNLKLLSYETKSQNQNSDANVIVKLVFKDETSSMIFSVISQNKNADIANINAIKEAFYYFILCRKGTINHVQSKLLEVKYGDINW